jgi:hypothetical protein
MVQFGGSFQIKQPRISLSATTHRQHSRSSIPLFKNSSGTAEKVTGPWPTLQIGTKTPSLLPHSTISGFPIGKGITSFELIMILNAFKLKNNH